MFMSKSGDNVGEALECLRQNHLNKETLKSILVGTFGEERLDEMQGRLLAGKSRIL